MSQATVASPCVGVCEMNPDSGLCLGCLRTIEEIAGWRDADDRRRTEIIQRLAARRAAGFKSNSKRATTPLPVGEATTGE